MSEQLTSNLNRIESLKKEVRANLRAQLQSVSAVQRQQMSSDAARQLAATPEFVSARTIMIFLSL